MIESKFILNNYIKGAFIKSNRKAGNSTYFYKNGRQYTVSRESNYVYGKNPDGSIGIYMENGDDWFKIDEALYENGSFVKLFIPNHTSVNDVGYEDPRCIKWNNTQYIMFNRRNIASPQIVQMHIGEIDENLNYVNDKTLPSLIPIEKNWQPIETMPGYCVYSYKPFKIINVFNGSFRNVQNDSPINFRGSSQIVGYKNNNLCVVHVRNEAFVYLSYLILFDNEMHILRISEPFSFFGANVEFVTHAEYNGKLHILVSVHDQIVYEFTLDDILIEDILNKKLDNCNMNNEIFTRFYNDAVSNGNIFGALGISTFSTDVDVISDAVQRNHNEKYFSSHDRLRIQSTLIGNVK